jgi:hypothetical protein
MKRPKQPKRLKVGVTLYLRSGQQSLWENGIFQNCFFLIMLLNKSPLVERAYIVNGGEGKPEEATEFLAMAPAPVIDLDTAMQQLDVVIELSAQLNPAWATSFRERGGRVVGMRVANDYVIDIERMIFDLPHGMLMSGTPYDAVWTLPAFEKTCLSYYKTGLRAPVTAMQHLWSPVLVERSVAALTPARRFGYAPGRKRWRLAILEPNICMVKTAHLPMLLCDVAHRQDPDFIEYLRVYNAMSLKEQKIFVDFARGLDLVRHGVATFEPRSATYEIMTTTADAIVAHHWENAQNYIYYEALHGGYPLIHNSTLLGGCGYYYPDFDCDEGALALRQAFHEHDGRLADYQSAARTFIETLNPESDRNIASYGAALSDLFNDG